MDAVPCRAHHVFGDGDHAICNKIPKLAGVIQTQAVQIHGSNVTMVIPTSLRKIKPQTWYLSSSPRPRAKLGNAGAVASRSAGNDDEVCFEPRED
jgi:hypothetical protein